VSAGRAILQISLREFSSFALDESSAEICAIARPAPYKSSVRIIFVDLHYCTPGTKAGTPAFYLCTVFWYCATLDI
jgi:hypothetical protein